MKLKFRADGKDILIFVVFSIFLLYFIAIAVVNIGTFATDGTFAGLNPLPAFSEDYLLATIVGYIAVIAIIITSVSSLFFDREKGFGISTSPKKDGGYARWATQKEIKKQLVKVDPTAEKIEAAGIPMIMKPGEVWVDNGEYHNLVIGSTGAGKTQTTVLPMVNLLSKKGESMIVTDPKGEIFEGTSNMLKSKGYNIVLLNFRDPQQGNAWNPLSLPYSLYKQGNSDKACELLEDLALNILYDESSKNQDPFWEKTSADYFTGLALALFDDAKEEEINLNSINLMTTVGEEKFAGTTYVKEYFSYKDPAGPAYVNASSTLMAPSDTKGSILSVFKQKIKLFSSRENMSEMLSHSDFDMKEIGRQKTAVFIVIQDEKKTYHSLVTIFLKQCYETLISVAQEAGGKLPYRTNFILDEFANMPPLKDVTTMVTAARSRAMRFTFIIQNFAQLYEVYGKENGETIKGNCGNIVYLISSELSALEEISKMCGEVKSKEKDKTASTPLVTVSDLQRLKQWETIVLRIRTMPFKTKLTPNFQMDWGTNFPKAGYPTRDRVPVETFDIKSFVEKKKEEKINAMLNGEAPSGGMQGGMPFMPPMFGGMNDSGFNSNSSGGGFNVDDLVKRIDEQIAALEAEERKEKEKQQPIVIEGKETVVENNSSEESVATTTDVSNNETNTINNSIINMPVTEIVDDTAEADEEPVINGNNAFLNQDGDLSSKFVKPLTEEDNTVPGITADTTIIKDYNLEEDNNIDSEVVSNTENNNDESISNDLNDYDAVTDDQFFDDFFGEDE